MEKSVCLEEALAGAYEEDLSPVSYSFGQGPASGEGEKEGFFLRQLPAAVSVMMPGAAGEAAGGQ
jgi:hypothetical protein